ncbi:MAG: 2-C-methyl-D-erythritol 2,4-cyclodiphosphate synthase, partial [Clostridia bacterium]|nr:2-C-methyl-D-erythritol 2,4-cyclodiphosphate synthase [Clostridia bacterium]
VFDRDLLTRGYDALLSRGNVPTDDCSAAEAAGAEVHIVEGSPRNIKITTPEDFMTARGLIGLPALRIGHGYDVHRLVEGRRLILGGVDIPFEKGLLGHSDADVLTHAVADACLGALALGDIGKHFPDSDPKYAGADSLQLLAHVAALCREAGYRVDNMDATLLCQRPKLLPHISAMRENLARALGISPDAVSVKATTEEGLGFTGSGDGIAAHAVALLSLL